MKKIVSNTSDNYRNYLNQSPTFSMAPTNTREIIAHLKALKSDTSGQDVISLKVLKYIYKLLVVINTYN